MLHRSRWMIVPALVLSAACAWPSGLPGLVSQPTERSSSAASPSWTPRPTPTTVPLPEQYIAIRDGDAFYDRRTGTAFVPRGANYLHFAAQVMPGGEERYQDATFATDAYEGAAADAALGLMHGYGYNVVRVFLIDSVTGLVGNGAGLSQGYVDNVADFLGRAAARDVFVWLTVDWLPGGKYGELSNRECCDRFGSTNLQILTEGGIQAVGTLYADLYQELLARGAPVEDIFSFELRNEVYFDSTSPPLSFAEGRVRPGNGRFYDMSSPEQRQRMMDESLVFFIDRARQIIREVAPTALVSVGFFVPQGPVPARAGDTRLIETRPAIWDSSADFIDLHGYPGFELDLAGHVTNFGMEGMRERPIMMGEFGAFRSNYSSPTRGAAALQRWQVESCSYGFDGWLLWHWDTAEDEALWNAMSGDGAIASALAPSLRPDPCQP